MTKNSFNYSDTAQQTSCYHNRQRRVRKTLHKIRLESTSEIVKNGQLSFSGQQVDGGKILTGREFFVDNCAV